MGFVVFAFITTLFAGVVTFLVTTGVAGCTGRMFVDVPPATEPGGESAAKTAVATAKQTITVTTVVEIAFIDSPFLSQLTR
jgi:hypothetical protein